MTITSIPFNPTRAPARRVAHHFPHYTRHDYAAPAQSSRQRPKAAASDDEGVANDESRCDNHNAQEILRAGKIVTPGSERRNSSRAAAVWIVHQGVTRCARRVRGTH